LFVLNLASRAGVAQYMKTEWRVVAIFNVVLFVVLVSQLFLPFFLILRQSEKVL